MTAPTDQAPGGSEAPPMSDYMADILTSYGFSPSAIGRSDTSEPAGEPPAAETPRDESEGTDPDTATDPTAGEPPADESAIEAGETPDAEDHETPEADPLEGAEPLSYVVDGQSRTFEGITKLKGGGAIVDPEQVAVLERRLGERDHLFERGQAQYKELTDLQDRIRWKPDGAADYVTGHAAIKARDLDYAKVRAERDTYEGLLSDPTRVMALLTMDGDGRVGWNADAVRAIRAELSAAKTRLEFEIEKYHAQHAGTSASPQPTPTPAVEPTAIVDAVVTDAGLAGVTDADKQWAKALAPKYFHPAATQADVAANPMLKLGQPWIEQQFVDLLKERMQLRAASTSAAQADKQNRAKLAGVRPTSPRPKPAAVVPAPAATETTAEDNWVNSQLLRGASMMRMQNA